MQTSLNDLINTLPQIGTVTWIGLRPGKKQTMRCVDTVLADGENGLIGDRYAARNNKRQVTLMQVEHLKVIASIMNRTDITPELFRRNILVSGINLLALKDKKFTLGEATLQMTGLCHPCSYMEKVLGAGGYNAMRGHGGITARVVQSGNIKVGDSLTYN